MTEITAVVLNYNGGDLVLRVIESLLAQKGVQVQVLVVDDGSTDGSPSAIEERFPGVTVYRESTNTGDVVRLRNTGLSLAGTDKVFLTDNDVEFDDSCLKELIGVMEAEENVGACIPRLIYLDDRSRIYHEGSEIHYIGTSSAPTRDKPVDEVGFETKIAVGGGIGLLDMVKLRQVGNFDEGYRYKFAWGADGELYQRLMLAGFKCYCVPSATGYHKAEPFDVMRQDRARGQLCNRWRFILTHYSGRTLLLIAPALVVFELVQISYYLLKRIPLLYLKGTLDAVRQLPENIERRKTVQALRVIPDKELLHAGPLYVRTSGGVAGRLVSAGVSAVGSILSAYWSLIRPLLSRRRSIPVETRDQRTSTEALAS